MIYKYPADSVIGGASWPVQASIGHYDEATGDQKAQALAAIEALRHEASGMDPAPLGLASVQIGSLVPAFIIGDEAFIWPMYTIHDKALNVTLVEGCYSLVDGHGYQVKRYLEIDVKYLDTDFKLHEETLTGRKAQIYQHEADHLYGRLCWKDDIPQQVVDRRALEKVWNQARRGNQPPFEMPPPVRTETLRGIDNAFIRMAQDAIATNGFYAQTASTDTDTQRVSPNN